MTPDPDRLSVVHQAALLVASRLVGVAAAEDIAQEATLRAVPRLEEIAHYPGPWAVRVATNLSLDLLRRETRTSYTAVPDSLAKAVDSELRLDLRRALGALPERQRQVVALRYISDLDERTTADLLGISPGSVKRHLHRATATLRTSPHLTPLAPPRKATRMRTWTDDFTPAIEPDDGWQKRPWDHWRLESSFGRVSRVAVIDGEPVLDAEGDEVMEGPGFDFQVVKILPSAWHDEEEPVMRTVRDVPGLLGELLAVAREESDRFGHVWVGDEHLTLAMAARELPGLPAFATIEEAVAKQYDGPLAHARLARVRTRRAGTPYLRDPVPKVFTLPIDQLLEATKGRAATAKEIVSHLTDRPYSTLSRLAC
ncbi:MAG: sigma-70 family RNA polymerase sigma factor [Mycobacteriales bacterium]